MSPERAPTENSPLLGPESNGNAPQPPSNGTIPRDPDSTEQADEAQNKDAAEARNKLGYIIPAVSIGV